MRGFMRNSPPSVVVLFWEEEKGWRVFLVRSSLFSRKTIEASMPHRCAASPTAPTSRQV